MNNETVTCGIVNCRDNSEINVCGSLQISLQVDSEVLRNPFQTILPPLPTIIRTEN